MKTQPTDGLPVTTFLLAFGALFSIVNPLSGAFIFYGATRGLDARVRAQVSRWVGIYAFCIVTVSLYIGAYVLSFFGITIPVNFKQCVTQQDVDSSNAYVNRQGLEGCTPPEVKRKGGEITIKYACTKPKMTGEGKGTVTDDTFTMDMKVTQHEMGDNVMKTSLTAKRLGDCAK